MSCKVHCHLSPISTLLISRRLFFCNDKRNSTNSEVLACLRGGWATTEPKTCSARAGTAHRNTPSEQVSTKRVAMQTSLRGLKVVRTDLAVRLCVRQPTFYPETRFHRVMVFHFPETSPRFAKEPQEANRAWQPSSLSPRPGASGGGLGGRGSEVVD